MPRDKTATRKKLYECMKKEFLEKGFEKASLNQIARDCGITPAAVYRHFASKEAMFEALVAPAWQEFEQMCAAYMEQETTGISTEHISKHFSGDGTEWLELMLDMIYRYFDEFRLLLCCAKGTRFANIEDTFVKMEEESVKDIMKAMQKAGISDAHYTDAQVHIICTAYVTALFEVVRHNVPRQQATEQLTFLYRFFNCSWKHMLGLDL